MPHSDEPRDGGDRPVVDLNDLALTEVRTEDQMYSDVLLPLDLPEAPELQAFSMEHWLYLAAKGVAPAAPTELSPFPLPLHSAESYVRNLRDWELIDDMGKPYPELLELMDKLTTRYDKAVWGTVRFPLRAHEREYEFDSESQNWQLPSKQLIVPRVPFLITWTSGGEIISATSTEEGMNINRRPAEANYLTDFAEEVMMILDPSGAWGPRDFPSIRVTREFAEELAADPEVGSMAAQASRTQWRDAVNRVAQKHGVDSDTALRLTEILSVQPAVVAEFIVTVHRPDGMEATPEETSGTLVFYSDETGGIGSIHSPYDSYGGRIVLYEPGTRESVVRSLKAMFIDAANTR